MGGDEVDKTSCFSPLAPTLPAPSLGPAPQLGQMFFCWFSGLPLAISVGIAIMRNHLKPSSNICGATCRANHVKIENLPVGTEEWYLINFDILLWVIYHWHNYWQYGQVKMRSSSSRPVRSCVSLASSSIARVSLSTFAVIAEGLLTEAVTLWVLEAREISWDKKTVQSTFHNIIETVLSVFLFWIHLFIILNYNYLTI